ncbi:MAG: outer membrane protein [Acidobacteriaceae bacterium]
MKKTILLGVLMLSAAAGFAQESRQDVSFSGTGVFAPTIHGQASVVTNSTASLGLLTSYRYMLTPHSALELNYSFTQNNAKYCIGGGCIPGSPPPYTSNIPNQYSYRIHSRMQEVTAAYAFSWTIKRYNPFVEAGIGTLIFTPVLDNQTTILYTKTTKGFTGLFGGGMAYELSPSFDIRAEYRAFVVKTPTFGESNGPTGNLTTNRYEILSMPTLGVAYHF